MKPLTTRERDIAGSLALALADAMRLNLPSLFAEPPETLVAVLLPVAEALVRGEAKAARNKKHARKYRKLQRHVRAMLRTEPESLVPQADLRGTVPFDLNAWHTELRPGAGHEVVRAGDVP